MVGKVCLMVVKSARFHGRQDCNHDEPSSLMVGKIPRKSNSVRAELCKRDGCNRSCNELAAIGAGAWPPCGRKGYELHNCGEGASLGSRYRVLAYELVTLLTS